MGLWDKLRQASRDVNKLRLAHGRDSYFQYKGRREHERKQEDHARAHAADEAEREREKAERERGYDERYTRERERGTARDQAERAGGEGPAATKEDQS
jgi:hypothetical protein